MSRRGRFIVLALIVCLMVQLAMPVGALAASGTYSLVDIVHLARVLSGSASLDAAQQARYDLNGDGRVNILDLSLIAEAVLAATQQVSQNAALTQRVVCDTCHQYPCVCNSAVTSVAQPTACPSCSHYPCVCSTSAQPQPTVCGTCHHYPCTCNAGAGSSSGSTAAWTCGNCHSYPCVCSGSGSGWSSGYHHASSTGHHGHGHC